MRVRLLAFDVDNLTIAHTRVPIEFRFNNESLPVRWEGGSNSYAADVSAALTQFSGEYELLVAVESGWNHTTRNVTRCELMRTMIVVESDSKEIIVAACLASVLVLTLGLLGYLVYRNKERAKEILLSFLNFEGLLIAELCMEAWVRGALCCPRYLCPNQATDRPSHDCLRPCGHAM
jgi:hypothetical protein